jgi:predicted KAP-like P-loop ATPase
MHGMVYMFQYFFSGVDNFSSSYFSSSYNMFQIFFNAWNERLYQNYLRLHRASGLMQEI